MDPVHDADRGLENLRHISEDFAAFCTEQGKVSEADTRVKVVDRILKDALLWPEASIVRETPSAAGYSDYSLKARNRRLVLVEAKREGIAFTPPTDKRHRSLKLNGALMSDPEIKAAIEQVQHYSGEEGIRYAIATNGYCWIVFRAMREERGGWRAGHARVFPSLEFITEHFTTFWNLLSFAAVEGGSLDQEFGNAPIASRSMDRVLDKLYNADLPLRRNRLNDQLQPIIKAFFEDIADQDNLDLFRKCYVHHATLQVVASDVNVVITDAIPKFLVNEGGIEVRQTDTEAGVFSDSLTTGMNSVTGQLYLLLGGIGSGKTTFLKRYQQVLGAKLLQDKTLWFHIDFLAAPLDPEGMEQFVWTRIRTDIRGRYANHELELRRKLKKMFADSIAAARQTTLKGLHPDSEPFEAALSPYLANWQEDLKDYIPRLLRYSRTADGRAPVIFIDNVDQLDPPYQSKVFLLAQRITRLIGSSTIIALREESYYAASAQNTFTAYTSRKFHIASPQFRAMIGNRIDYAIDQLKKDPSEMTVTSLQGYEFDREDISEFLKIVQHSVFSWSRLLARFIESICFGNMRLALDMFSTFITSGASDVNKMLNIYRRDGEYFVAFHEFLKSIALGDRSYYKEEFSEIFNCFNCTAEKNSSHFTAVRLLATLLKHRSESSVEGQGYVEIGRIIGMFEDLFDNTRDLAIVFDRLVAKQLIEVNTRSISTVIGASHTRITSAGWYYLKRLIHKFAYLDLVLQDTPISDSSLVYDLRTSVYDVNNLGDREDNKLERTRVRFTRVRKFLAYLEAEEEKEISQFGRDQVVSFFPDRFVPFLIRRFNEEAEYIERRLFENRQRFSDDMPIPDEDEETPEIFGRTVDPD